ncbi:hypothetical protein N7467_011426 [Penicillium canescens]|nr:hypothetical protein N7467_011426 [Penicillium canescens]
MPTLSLKSFCYWLMGAQFNSSAVTAVLAGAYKTFQSTRDAVVWRVNALGKPAMTQLAMDRGLCMGPLRIAIQTVLVVTLISYHDSTNGRDLPDSEKPQTEVKN